MSPRRDCSWRHPRFEVMRAATEQEALALLALHPGASVLAGGTDLLVRLRGGKREPGLVIDISSIGGLAYVTEGTEFLAIGALTRLDDIVCSDAVGRNVPVLAEAARTIGSQQIRNVATLGGNLCNASPSADMSPALVALRGTAVVRSMAGEREVAFEDFFRGPGATCLAADEILVEIKVPKPGPATGAWYAKLHARSAIDLAVVGVAAAVTLESDGSTVSDARLVLGAVAPVPLRAREAERMFIAAGLSEDALARVAETAAGEAQPISDIRATAEYRREMVRVLTAQALRKAAARVNGATP